MSWIIIQLLLFQLPFVGHYYVPNSLQSIFYVLTDLIFLKLYELRIISLILEMRKQALRGVVTCPWLHSFVTGLGFEPKHSSSKVWTRSPSYTVFPRIFWMFQRIQSFPLQSSLYIDSHVNLGRAGKHRTGLTWGGYALSVVPGQSRSFQFWWGPLPLRVLPPLLWLFCFVKERKGPGRNLGT